MKKYFLLPLFGLLSLAALGQKTIHDANAEVRKVGSFHAISVSGGIDLYLAEGDEAVAVSGRDAETTSKIETVVENGVLKISFDWKENIRFTGQKHLKAYVSFKKIDKLSASGGSDVMLDGNIKSKDFTLSISGGSDFKGSVDVDNLKVEQSGGSDIDIKGRADEVKIDASGGSDFDGYGLTTNNCKVDVSGGSDVNITVNNELRAQASGASDVNMRGPGKIVEKRASGASDIRKS
jgi:Putative auto-transporter adhesin, head GIN domain